jgi:glycosyltransferase involved in cell wall biosynthesis
MGSEAAPRVSAVISVIDPHPVYFPEAVRSILGQTLSDLELIIIEEPHGRRVVDVLQGIDDPRIRHFCHPHRTSLVDQRNRGLEHARSEFVALLDADDICMPQRFEKQLAFLQANPDVGVVGSQLEIMDHEGRTIGYRAYPTDSDQLKRVLPIYNPIAQPGCMLRRSVALAVGGYQYKLHMFVEDYELWIRMAKHGYRLANLPEPLTRYRIHPAGAKTSSLRSSLLGTIDVKRIHFGGQMSLPAQLRLLGERVLLRLPGPVVIKLFVALQVRQKKAR